MNLIKPAAGGGGWIFARFVVQKLVNKTGLLGRKTTIVGWRRKLAHKVVVGIGRVVRIVADSWWWCYGNRNLGVVGPRRWLAKDLIWIHGDRILWPALPKACIVWGGIECDYASCKRERKRKREMNPWIEWSGGQSCRCERDERACLRKSGLVNGC